MLLADYDAYIKCQDRVNQLYLVNFNILQLPNARKVFHLI